MSPQKHSLAGLVEKEFVKPAPRRTMIGEIRARFPMNERRACRLVVVQSRGCTTRQCLFLLTRYFINDVVRSQVNHAEETRIFSQQRAETLLRRRPPIGVIPFVDYHILHLISFYPRHQYFCIASSGKPDNPSL